MRKKKENLKKPSPLFSLPFRREGEKEKGGRKDPGRGKKGRPCGGANSPLSRAVKGRKNQGGG